MYKFNKIDIKRISPLIKEIKDIKYECKYEESYPETPKLKPCYIEKSPNMTKLLLEPLEVKLNETKLVK